MPGAELREALRRWGWSGARSTCSERVSLEGFYQYEWEETVIDPPGTYFSTNDFAGRGGTHVFLAFASFPDTGESPFYIQPPVDHPFMGVPRAADQEPDDGGQYGLALRWFVPELDQHRVRLLLHELPQPAADDQRHHRDASQGADGRRRRRGRRRRCGRLPGRSACRRA